MESHAPSSAAVRFCTQNAEQSPGFFRQSSHMTEAFPVQFVGGSRDGAIIDADNAPDHVAVTLNNGIQEIYERQNNEPPFVYVQVGYVENEPSK